MGTNSVVRWFTPRSKIQSKYMEGDQRASTFFGGFDKLQERIRKMLDPGRCRTRLFGYMLDAMVCQKDSEETGTAPERHPDCLPERTTT